MSTQLSDVKNKITYWVDDLLKGYFTDTQLNRFVNDAAFETQKMLLQAGQNYYVTLVETQLVVAQKEYILPADFLHLHRLEVITQGHGTTSEVTNPVLPITINQQDIFPLSQGTPQVYYLKNNRIVVYPAPDNSLFLRMHYSYRVAPLILDTDLLDCPDEYAEMVALYAAMDCFIKDNRDPTQIATKLNDYAERLKREAEDRLQDTTRMVVSTDVSGTGSLW
jgi:hypothetical protein